MRAGKTRQRFISFTLKDEHYVIELNDNKSNIFLDKFKNRCIMRLRAFVGVLIMVYISQIKL